MERVNSASDPGSTLEAERQTNISEDSYLAMQILVA